MRRPSDPTTGPWRRQDELLVGILTSSPTLPQLDVGLVVSAAICHVPAEVRVRCPTDSAFCTMNKATVLVLLSLFTPPDLQVRAILGFAILDVEAKRVPTDGSSHFAGMGKLQNLQCVPCMKLGTGQAPGGVHPHPETSNTGNRGHNYNNTLHPLMRLLLNGLA